METSGLASPAVGRPRDNLKPPMIKRGYLPCCFCLSSPARPSNSPLRELTRSYQASFGAVVPAPVSPTAARRASQFIDHTLADKKLLERTPPHRRTAEKDVSVLPVNETITAVRVQSQKLAFEHRPCPLRTEGTFPILRPRSCSQEHNAGLYRPANDRSRAREANRVPHHGHGLRPPAYLAVSPDY
jgi:hypothetical protein